MTLQWTEDTKPDRPGIWWLKGNMQPAAVTEENIHRWMVGTWCRSGDLPTIVDAPKYRDVNQGDVGREIEVKTEGKWRSEGRTLIGFMSTGHVVYELNANGWPNSALPDRARILDTGPVKQPREVWIASHRNGGLSSIQEPTKEEAERHFDGDWKAVKFVEVIDDACGSKS